MNASTTESPAPGFAADEDQESAKAALSKLSVLNGYAEVFSIFEGETLNIRVARKSAPLLWRRPVHVRKVEIRDAVSGVLVATHKPPQPTPILEQDPASYRDKGAAYECLISMDTAGWPPAVYECIVRDSAGSRSEDIFFNIKPRSVEEYDLLCILPSFTWQAYNRIGGGSFYSDHLGLKRTISTLRPLCRRGDNGIDASLVFLAAFAEEKVKFACVDSWDLHREALPEGRVPVMALLTHDEYWSVEMRTQINRYLRRHGVLLVMAGNVCWWRVAIDGDTVTVNKEQTAQGSRWSLSGTPEEKTFLSSYRFGGYGLEHAKKKKSVAKHVLPLSRDEIRAAGALTVVKPDHPIFAGVKLGPGNTFGGEVPIVYREVDGIPLTKDGRVDRQWYDADEIEPEIIATGLTATYLRYSPIERVGVIAEAYVRRGYVVHMGSFGWSLGLVQKNEAVKRVVLNAYRYCRSFGRAPRKTKAE